MTGLPRLPARRDRPGLPALLRSLARALVPPAVLLLAALAAYHNSLAGPFVYDDLSLD